MRTLGWGFPAERFVWAAVELVGDRAEMFGGADGQVRALREVLPEQTVCVLVRAALPGREGLAPILPSPGRREGGPTSPGVRRSSGRSGRRDGSAGVRPLSSAHERQGVLDSLLKHVVGELLVGEGTGELQ